MNPRNSEQKVVGPQSKNVIHGSALLVRRCAPDASWTCPDPNMVKRS